MTGLDHHAEAYSGSGGMAAQGVRKLLGAPGLTPLTTLVRESVQNSWDARCSKIPGPDDPPPRWRVNIRSLSNKQRATLSEMLGDRSPESDTGEQLQGALQNPDLAVIQISDWQTKGLGGPTDPRVAVREEDVSDYVDFLFNIGSERDTAMGGGTYGFGKSALFKMSRCHTLLVHTRTLEPASDPERLIAVRVGDSFNRGGNRFTGRQWWGIKDHEGACINPVTGTKAASLARKLGLPDRSDESLAGTTLMILDADIGDLRAAGNSVTRAILWNFWPKLVSNEERPVAHMDFEILVENDLLPLPDIRSTAPFKSFARSFDRLVTNSTEDTKNITYYREDIGRLAFDVGLHQERQPPVSCTDTETQEESPVPERCHHVALMRPAELVVRYVEGPPHFREELEYGGVFICAGGPEGSIEGIFASSEPPAHDDWVPTFLSDRREKGIVRKAIKAIKAAMRELVEPGEGERPTGERTWLGAIAADLGAQLGLGAGTAPGPRAGARTRGARPARPRVGPGVPRFHRLENLNGTPHALFRCQVTLPDSGQMILRAETMVSVTGGRERPEVLGLEPIRPRWRVAGEGAFSDEADEWSAPAGGSEVDVEVAAPITGSHALEVSILQVEGGDL